MSRILPEKSDEFVVRTLFSDGMHSSILPAYGYIDRIEIRPINDTPNMDASRPMRFRWQIIDGDGKEIECEVKLISRGIKIAGS